MNTTPQTKREPLHAAIPAAYKSESGLTLIELMIAMTLGLLLTAIIGTVFVSSKTSFNTASQLSRIQETTRFSTTFLKRDIRNSGYTGCGVVAEFKDLLAAPTLNQNGLYGWDAAGTGANNSGSPFDLSYQIISDGNPTDIAATRTSNSSGGSWFDLSGTALPSTLQSVLRPLRGSDILVLSESEIVDIELDGINNTTTNSLGTTTKISGIIEPYQIVRVGNCQTQDQFQNVASTGSAISAGNGGSSAQPGNKNGVAFTFSRAWGPESKIYTDKTQIYYVGTGAGGIPSLFRYESNCNLDTNCIGGTNSEIVEGVENMQVLYGEDTDSPADFIANVYRSANTVNDFKNVVSIRFGLLVRSPLNAKDQDDTGNYELVDSVTINPPNERFIRFVSNNTVHLRNKGL